MEPGRACVRACVAVCVARGCVCMCVCVWFVWDFKQGCVFGSSFLPPPVLSPQPAKNSIRASREAPPSLLPPLSLPFFSRSVPEAGVRDPESLTEGGAAKHGRGMLHVRYRPIILAQLGLIVRREGSVVMFDEPERGSHQVYLCHAPRAVLEGGSHKPPVPVWHTCRLCARGKVAV